MDNRFLYAFSVALEPSNLFYCALGSILGTIVGVLPGLGPAATCAMLLAFTTHLPAEGAIIMLAGIYYGSQYGGSTTSILVNVPGEAASVVTCIDGFPMARKGRAGEALFIAAAGSFIAGTVGVFATMMAAPSLAEIGLHFGPPEYFWLMMLGLVGVASFSGEALLKGIISVAFGLMLATIGLDPVSGIERLTFGWSGLIGGLEVVSLFMGLFGVAEIITCLEEQREAVYKGKLGRLFPRGKEMVRGLLASLRGTVIGFIPGLLPGVAPAVTAFWAYDLEKRFSKTPRRFGQGAIEGVAAPEAANNATSQAGFIPLLCFGIPTTATWAIVLAALVLHGLQPGPILFERHPHFVWALIGSMYIGNIMLLILNIPLIGLWARISLLPYKVIGPSVLAICLVGSYSVRNSMFDVWNCMIFGVVGYFMKKRNWPAIALVLGFILGDLLEQSLRQSLEMSGGTVGILVRGGICKVLAAFALVMVFAAVIGEWRGKKKSWSGGLDERGNL